MDCMDCHNRPAHTFFFSPERAIDSAIAQGRIPRELPFARREAAGCGAATYPNRAAALGAIAARLTEFYASRGHVDPAWCGAPIAGHAGGLGAAIFFRR